MDTDIDYNAVLRRYETGDLEELITAAKIVKHHVDKCNKDCFDGCLFYGRCPGVFRGCIGDNMHSLINVLTWELKRRCDMEERAKETEILLASGGIEISFTLNSDMNSEDSLT